MYNIKKPLFISIEGIDCSGKTSLVNELKIELPKHEKIYNFFNQEVIFSFEPGSDKFSFLKKIRSLLFDEKKNINIVTESLLFFVNRSEHVEKLIIPTLQNNGLVICDRFFLSTIAYQGYYEGLDINFLDYINNKSCKNIKPDITFYLDISEDTFKERYIKKKKDNNINAFDERYSKYIEIKNAYSNALNYLRKKEYSIICIDGNQSSKENTKLVIEFLNKFIDSCEKEN